MKDYLLGSMLLVYFATAFSLGWVFGLDFSEDKQPTQKSQEEIHYENIKGFYNKRLIQFRKQELDERQYRDSLYVDLETYMILNK